MKHIEKTLEKHRIRGLHNSESSPSQSEVIYKYLEQEIISGRLAPGERLNEAAICEKFNVSRTPVREAYIQLAAIDFVTLRQRVGAVVSTLSLQRMVQMFEVMAKYEGAAAALAAERMTPHEHRLLRAAADACTIEAESKEATAQDSYAEANFQFHEIIYRGSHNDYLCELATSLRKRLAPYRRYWLSTVHRRRKSAAEHEAVVVQILNGAVEEARDAMEQHLNLQAGLLAELLDKLPSEFLKVVK